MWKRAARIFLYIIAIGYACITLFPFLWSFFTSLKLTPDTNKWWVPVSRLTMENYTNLIFSHEYPFFQWFINSLIVAAVVTVGNLIINSMAGFALARIPFRGRSFLFYLVLGIMMIPPQVILVPIYILLSKLNWVDTYYGLTIPWMVNSFGIFLMRQFFLSIPRELEEAGFIDGLSRWGVFWKIILPLSKPALATQTIFIFMGNWNSFMWPNLLASSEEMYTLPVGLSTLYGEYNAFWNHILAGTMIMTIPIIIVFLIFQRHFIRGIATTGIK
ncbi:MULTISPECIES: carbohydrate ABC transporter permease [Thermoactinomyces]|jgi:multiple sugar transport system permease protein|uniref:Carbohydrate ABC transporter permease n=1 Tax=Thermoactinomyces daqus TaxID=1329516 RepID=A0A7W1XD30_9BACL|nr:MULTISPECIES: carbohydrate ABC transporter permease [Thermoactinomyces]MBA4544343.1 carbohydrate ABC transporter permease [Thermoactinomyces daqus]MBH8599204.1 carbohydrate ABC transporter permease [Thermoactinomyces sp. CICC 10523]MBH8609401.1 carbohydrate ABC transporter permease [Thermoactinomyces sp. CICC 10521]